MCGSEESEVWLHVNVLIHARGPTTEYSICFYVIGADVNMLKKKKIKLELSIIVKIVLTSLTP